MSKIYKTIVGFISLLLVWILLSQLNYFQVPPQTAWFTSPAPVFYAFIDIFTEEYWYLLSTLGRVVGSIVIVLTLGVASGLFFGHFDNLYEYCEGVFDFWRSIPPIIVLPIFFFVDPRGEFPRIALVVFGCFPLIVMQIADSLRKISTERKDFAHQIGADALFKIRNILIYEILPSLFISIRTVVSLSFIIIVVTEMVRSAESGVGYGINSRQYADDGKAFTYAYAIIIGALGFAFNSFIRWIENRFFSWSK